jgi:hypothetical protein
LQNRHNAFQQLLDLVPLWVVIHVQELTPNFTTGWCV